MAFRLAARSTYPGSHPAPTCNREAADSRRPAQLEARLRGTAITLAIRTPAGRAVAEEVPGRLKNPDIGRSLNPLGGEIGLAAAGTMAGHAGRRHKARYERRSRKVDLRSAAGAGLEMGNPSAQLSWAVDGVDRLAEVLG